MVIFIMDKQFCTNIADYKLYLCFLWVIYYQPPLNRRIFHMAWLLNL